MDVQIKSIKLMPAKYKADGDMEKPEYAQIALEVKLDTQTHHAEVVDLMKALRKEYVRTTFEPYQSRMSFEEKADKAFMDESSIQQRIAAVEEVERSL